MTKRYMDTPNLDRIANEGVRFTNSFVANSLSGSSRACMLTGKHSCENKFYDNSTCVFDFIAANFSETIAESGLSDCINWEMAFGKFADRLYLLGNSSRTR